MATNEILGKANSAVNDFKNRAHDADDQFAKLSHNAGKKLGAMASDLVSSTSSYVTTSRDYVAENPIKGVAIAAAAGVVVGSILTMSMRSSK